MGKERNKFKFNIGDFVFQVGISGALCISGRGHMEFISNGALNIYQTRRGYIPEYDLISMEEVDKITKSRKEEFPLLEVGK